MLQYQDCSTLVAVLELSAFYKKVVQAGITSYLARSFCRRLALFRCTGLWTYFFSCLRRLNGGLAALAREILRESFILRGKIHILGTISPPIVSFFTDCAKNWLLFSPIASIFIDSVDYVQSEADRDAQVNAIDS